MVSALGFVLMTSAHLSAWCPRGTPPVPYRTAYAFEAERDVTGWNALFLETRLGGTMSTDVVVESWIDRAAQTWSRYARAPVKLGFLGFTAGTVDAHDLDDGRSIIFARPCKNPDETTGKTWTGRGGTTCDIELRYDVPGGPACDNTTRLISIADTNGAGLGADRLLRHEMGHCLGLAHPWRGDACERKKAADNDEGCSEHGIMCIGGGCGEPRSDLPGGDDIEGVFERMTGEDFRLPAREVWIGDRALGVFAAAPPRIACAGEACALVRTHGVDEVHVHAFAGANLAAPLEARFARPLTVRGLVTRRSPDVAVGANTALVIVAEQRAHEDPRGENFALPSRALFVRLDPPALLDSGEIDPTSDDDVTPYEPRVTFADGRFLVVLAKRDRGFALYAHDARVGGAWTRLREIGGAISELEVQDSFDVDCTGAACTLVTARATTMRPEGENLACAFDLAGARFTTRECHVLDTPPGLPTSIARVADRLVVSGSARAPLATGVNTWTIGAALVGADASVCRPLARERGVTAFGGTSVAVAGEQVLHARWGRFEGGPEAAGGLCF
jgi:hypothetical protein